VKSNNPVQTKSYQFALRIVKLYLFLKSEKREYELSKQLLRSATSVGANVEEAIGAQSQKDFIHKLSIAYKEARETQYWLRLLSDSGIIASQESETLLPECEELMKIIGSILKTMKSK